MLLERGHFRFRETAHRVAFHQIIGRMFHGILSAAGTGQIRRAIEASHKAQRLMPVGADQEATPHALGGLWAFLKARAERWLLMAVLQLEHIFHKNPG